jgi:hypothetical protein
MFSTRDEVFISLYPFDSIPESSHFRAERAAEQVILDGFGQGLEPIRGQHASGGNAETQNNTDYSVALHCAPPEFVEVFRS